jgi:hypothetical protein
MSLSRVRLPRLWLPSCALAVALVRPAHAQNPAAAEALFEQARAAMASGSYDVACARFRDSDKLDPAVGTRFNLADCEERRGHVATAWSMFRGVATELNAEDDRKPIAEDRASSLEARLPYLTLQRTGSTPKDVHVHIDGVELGEASFGVALPMDPGKHELTLRRASTGAEQRSSFVLSEGERANLPLVLRPERPTKVEPSDDAAANSGGSARRTWTIAAGTIGVTGVAVGAVTGIITLSKKGTSDKYCSDEIELCTSTGVAANRSGRAFGIASGVSFGVGVVGLATAAYLWLTEPDSAPRSAHSSLPAPPARGRVSVNPQLAWSKNAGFLSVAGSF